MKVLIACIIYILFINLIVQSVCAEANFSFSINGGKKKGDMMTISSNLSGSNCGDEEEHIVEIVLTGQGAGYPFAADFSKAEITASLNGQPIPGHRRYVTNPPMINDIILHADPAFTYHPKTDTVTIYISNVKRGNVGGISFGVYLMEHDRGNDPVYDGCASGYKIYNTITPLSDSELLADYIPGQTSVPNEQQKVLSITSKKPLLPEKLPEEFKKLPFSSLAPIFYKGIQKLFL